MKFKMKVHLNESSTKIFNLDEESFYVEEEGNKLCFNNTYEDRFNTLISLFSLKNEWVKDENKKGVYELIFENNENVDLYNFSDEFPDNWFLFNSYIYNLVGEVYE